LGPPVGAPVLAHPDRYMDAAHNKINSIYEFENNFTSRMDSISLNFVQKSVFHHKNATKVRLICFIMIYLNINNTCVNLLLNTLYTPYV